MTGVIIRHFASSAALVDTPEQARNLYFKATLLPRSATRLVLQQKGISVAEVFRGSDLSKSVLLHAHENGAPRIVKIATEKSILHEYEVWSAVEATNQQDKIILSLWTKYVLSPPQLKPEIFQADLSLTVLFGVVFS
jgi:hypothetical protein